MAIKKDVDLTLDGVLEHFVGKPRDIQVEAIEKSIAHYNNGAQYVVLEAPVGTGKSRIAHAMSRAMGDDSHILTLTEQLQDQYIRDFSEMVALKGRGKFTCANAKATCAEGKHIFSGKHACRNCPYKIARAKAMSASTMVSNYHSFLFNVSWAKGEETEDAKPPLRPLLVVDEAHSMENFLLDAIGVTVRLTKISALVPPPPDETESPEPYFDYITEELLPKFNEVLPSITDPRSKDDLRDLISKLGRVISTKDTVSWIPERGTMFPKKDLDKTWFTLKPLNVAQWGQELWGFGRRQLFMSGTILSAYQFVSSVGLDPDQGEHVELDSPFPPENRPIYVGNLDMTKKARDESWPHVLAMTEKLMSAHPNEKGLLLCPSNEMLKYIQKGLSRTNNGRLIFAAGADRALAYNRHLVGKSPTVLAASGYWEGADLAGDASRFQIIPQAPRPMFQGQIAARAKKPGGDDWYRWLTWQKFLQGTGRSVRSETDTAVTYCFDRELRRELKRKDSMIPKWVQKACKLVGE